MAELSAGQWPLEALPRCINIDVHAETPISSSHWMSTYMEFTFFVVAPYPPCYRRTRSSGFQVRPKRWRRCGTLETARAGARRICHEGVRGNASTRRSEGTRRRGPHAGRDTQREAGCNGVKRPAKVTHRRTCRCRASFQLTLRRSGRYPAVAATIPWIFLGLVVIARGGAVEVRP